MSRGERRRSGERDLARFGDAGPAARTGDAARAATVASDAHDAGRAATLASDVLDPARAATLGRAPTSLLDGAAATEVDERGEAFTARRETGPRAVDASARPLLDTGFSDRYAVVRELGRGGMGEVHAVSDLRVGREVALKRVRGDLSDPLVARFMREARVQAQLEHPSIVPVYDLGVESDGSPYFTMKRLRGHTVAELLARRAIGGVPSQQVLRRVCDVCLAVAYAHQRGVVHRDLKPQNIMLGDFGEVYVLDWGVAKLQGGDDDRVDGDAEIGRTSAGAVLGTPGYMAPEQLRGEDVDARADVYSLGAILFEILTGEPLHGGNDIAELAGSVERGADARARVRAPQHDIAPELEAICVRATRSNPDERYQSVRDLHDELVAFIEGDRDLNRRRELADAHARRAEELRGSGSLEARGAAMRDAGRALALDPGNRRALEAVVSMMAEPPSEVPAEVAEMTKRAAMASARQGARRAAGAYLGGLALLAFAALLGLRDPWWVGTTAFFLVGGALWAHVSSRWDERVEVALWGGILWHALFLAFFTRAFGAFIAVPGFAAISIVGVLYNGLLPRPWLALLPACAAIVVPFGLEEIGVLAPSYSVEGGRLIVHSAFFDFGQSITYVLLVFSLFIVLMVASFIISLRRSNLDADRLAAMQAWHLRHLVPDEASTAFDVAVETDAASEPRCRVFG